MHIAFLRVSRCVLSSFLLNTYVICIDSLAFFDVKKLSIRSISSHFENILHKLERSVHNYGTARKQYLVTSSKTFI